MGGFLFLGLVVWITCAWFAAVVAGQKGRRQWLWALLGVVFGPFSLFVVYLMAPAPGARSPGQAAGKPKRQDPRASLYEVPKDKRR